MISCLVLSRWASLEEAHGGVESPSVLLRTHSPFHVSTPLSVRKKAFAWMYRGGLTQVHVDSDPVVRMA